MTQESEYEKLSAPAKAIVDRAIVDFTTNFRPNPHNITLSSLRASFSQTKELRRLAEKYQLPLPPECAKPKGRAR